MYESDWKEILQRFRISHQVFCLGSFEHGVTVLHQQVRALNLASALHEYGNHRPSERPFIVVGGGVGGSTCAAALGLLGHGVLLLEQSEILMPMQNGCATRWLHPYIYEWPDPGSERRTAELPFMSWRAGPAGEVIRRLTREFEHIQKQLGGRITTYCRARVGRLNQPWNSIEVTHPVPGGISEKRFISFEGLILAIGFGVEQTSGMGTPYWQNDNLHQIDPANDDRHGTALISGCGDGGLIDLQRAVLLNYRQDSIIDTLFPPDSNHDILTSLRSVKHDRSDGRDKSSTWLWEQLEEACRRHVSEFERLTTTLRSLTRKGSLTGGTPQIKLADKYDDFPTAISKSKCSLWNAFVAYAMYRADLFDYIANPHVQRSPDGSDFKVSDGHGVTCQVKRVVQRHGTTESIESTFRGFGIDPSTNLKGLRSASAQVPAARIANRSVCDYRWWATRINLDQQPDLRRDVRVEFAYDRTAALASMFADLCGHALAALLRSSESKVRVAVHRIGLWDGQAHYQQLGPYGGTRNSSPPEQRTFRPGRVFKVDEALTGRAIILGQPLVGRNVQGALADHDALGLRRAGANPINPEVQETLSWPVLSNAWNPSRTIMALFADSTESGFFRQEVYRAIVSMVNGFIENVEQVVSRQMRPVTTSFEGVTHNPDIALGLPPSIQPLSSAESGFDKQERFSSIRFFDFVSSDGEG